LYQIALENNVVTQECLNFSSALRSAALAPTAYSLKAPYPALILKTLLCYHVHLKNSGKGVLALGAVDAKATERKAELKFRHPKGLRPV